MTESGSDYPKPQSDQINQAYIDAWSEGRLRLQACGGCGALIFYPRPLCPECWSSDLAWVEHGGDATLVSFSLVERPNHPSFFDETPIILGEIRLRDGPAMLARIIGDDPGALRSGLPLELLPKEEGRRYPLPTFRPKRQPSVGEKP